MVTAQGHLHGVARHHRAVAHHRHRLDATHSEDARIRRIDDGGELVDAKHAEVRNREGVAFPIARLEFLVFGLLGKLAHFDTDLAKRLHVRMAHHRHEQAVFNRHGHTDVDVLVEANAVLQPAAVHGRVVLEGHGHGLHDHVVEADPVRSAVVDGLAGRHRRVHVNGQAQVEVRGREFALGQTTGNGLAHLRNTHFREAFHSCGRTCTATDKGFDVALDDAPAFS